MQFSTFSIMLLQLASAMIITSPKMGDVIHRNQLFKMEWKLSTKVKDSAEYRLGLQQNEYTWLIQDGKIPVHTDRLSQTFWGAIFPEPGFYAIVVYEVGAVSDDMPAFGSDFFTVV